MSNPDWNPVGNVWESPSRGSRGATFPPSMFPKQIFGAINLNGKVVFFFFGFYTFSSVWELLNYGYNFYRKLIHQSVQTGPQDDGRWNLSFSNKSNSLFIHMRFMLSYFFYISKAVIKITCRSLKVSLIIWNAIFHFQMFGIHFQFFI